MRKFIINNHKGGSCKTTSAVNLGAALAEKGKKVLLIDLDPQGSASIWFGQKRIQKGESLFSQDAEPGLVDRITIPTETENLFLIPNISIKERNNKDTKQSASRGNVLKTRLKELEESRYDFIFFDCAPGLNLVTLNALAAADELLIPIAANYLVLNGVISLLETIKTVKVKLNPNLHISGVLPSRVDAKVKHTLEILDLLIEKFGSLVYQTYIREDIKLAECPSFAKTIFQYDSKSMGAEDFSALADEILDR